MTQSSSGDDPLVDVQPVDLIEAPAAPPEPPGPRGCGELDVGLSPEDIPPAVTPEAGE